MANKTQTIRIESILGGIAPYRYVSSDNQYSNSYGIDPDASAGIHLDGQNPGGILRNVQVQTLTGVPAGFPLWIQTAPKENINTPATFIYDSAGSVYTTDGSSISGLGDLNDGGSSHGNGSSYYDNYMYFARDTTIARYGPLNGTASFTDDYWVGTLGKTALEQMSQWTNGNIGPAIYQTYPSHCMYVHNDGRLYFTDTVSEQGYVHYIATTKTSVEGDTDNGSRYQALDLPFGWYPTAISGSGSEIVIGAQSYKTGTSSYAQRQSAKIIFWDGISDSPTRIIDKGLPGDSISALAYVNGVLHAFVYTHAFGGSKVMRYVGGDVFEQVASLSYAGAPLPGGVLVKGQRLIFSSPVNVYLNQTAQTTTTRASLFAIGSNITGGDTIHNISPTTIATNNIYSIGNGFIDTDGTSILMGTQGTVKGVQYTYTGGSYASENISASLSQEWTSKYFTIGQRFKILSVTWQHLEAVDQYTGITPSIMTDNQNGIFQGETNGLPVVTNSNYSGLYRIKLQLVGVTGTHGFQLRLVWTGMKRDAINLPITIEYETYND